METIVDRNHEAHCHPYYERASHHTSIAALMMAFFATQGGLVIGGLVSLFLSGIAVWAATVFGLMAGAAVYSLCHVSSHASRLEDDIMTVTQSHVEVTELQEA